MRLITWAISKKPLILFFCFSLIILRSMAQTYPEMVKVKGGKFEMGDELNVGDSLERPVHPVKLKSYAIAKTEVTVLQWKKYCEETGNKLPDAPKRWAWIDSHPVRNISWTDATAYCGWLSNKTGKKYRLPTEAEWEYAARGGRSRKSFKRVVDETSWYKNNGDTTSHPVGEKKPNPLGIYDMTGNVWEWCHDWFGPYTASVQVNPQGSVTGVDRVTRGGSWATAKEKCGFANRGHHPAQYRTVTLGFRVVCD